MSVSRLGWKRKRNGYSLVYLTGDGEAAYILRAYTTPRCGPIRRDPVYCWYCFPHGSLPSQEGWTYSLKAAKGHCEKATRMTI